MLKGSLFRYSDINLEETLPFTIRLVSTSESYITPTGFINDLEYFIKDLMLIYPITPFGNSDPTLKVVYELQKDDDGLPANPSIFTFD